MKDKEEGYETAQKRFAGLQSKVLIWLQQYSVCSGKQLCLVLKKTKLLLKVESKMMMMMKGKEMS